MSEWTNYGDHNFAAYGGVMVRPIEERPNDYEFFQLMFLEEDLFAFHGVISDINEYEDDLQEAAVDLGYEDAKALIEKAPEVAVVELFGCSYGPMNFSATNKDGQGAYSTDMNDFKLSEQELDEFMSKLDIPDEFHPEFEYELTSKFEKNRGVEGSLKTNRWNEVEDWSHNKLMEGLYVEIKEISSGNIASLDPGRYEYTWDLRNGEFPVDERYMDVHYGDEDEDE